MQKTSPLAAPGAGIPTIERLVGGLQLQWLCLTMGMDATRQQFETEHRQLEQLTASTPAVAATRRVLIPRLPGLEDSSRDWSEWMTLEHLCIVNTQIAAVSRRLSRGQVPEGAGASTAAVKPPAAVDDSVRERFRFSCADLIAAMGEIASMGRQRDAVRYRHPWFGPLDARQWLVMATMHMGIHRRQIACIQRLREA